MTASLTVSITARAQEAESDEQMTCPMVEGFRTILDWGATDRLVICAVEDDDEGSTITKVEIWRVSGGKRTDLLTLTGATGSPKLNLWMGGFLAEANQEMHLHRLWFTAGTTTHVIESCHGGYKLCGSEGRYVRIEKGRKIADESWCPEEDCSTIWGGMREFVGQSLVTEVETRPAPRGSAYRATLRNTHPKFIQIQALPPALQALLAP